MLWTESPVHGVRARVGSLLDRIMRGDWYRYTSIANDELRLAATLEDNPLIIVHPGYRRYYLKEHWSFDGYDDYVRNIREAVAEAVMRGRSIIVFTPDQYKRETLQTLGIDKVDLWTTTILVPTVDNTTEVNDSLVGVSGETFWKRLGHYVTTAELAGEYRADCVIAVKAAAENAGIVIRDRSGCIYPPA